MSLERMLEEIAVARLALADARARSLALRLEVAARMLESARLRADARMALDQLAETRSRVAARATNPDSRLWRPRRPPGPPDEAQDHRQQLHKEYADTRDPAILTQLMASYDGFAYSLAVRFRSRETADDLLQVARIGLLKAIQRFDPGLGRPFLVFARATITGEIKRHIRDLTWVMRVPRALKDDYLVVIRAVDDLTVQLGKSPSMQALADHCDLSVERVVEALELRNNQWALSLDGAPSVDDDDLVFELGHDEIGFRQLEDRQLLSRLLSRLPERDRRIIELRFLADMTQAEIAAEVGVSQMCVSRVLARTVGRLRVWARTAVA